MRGRDREWESGEDKNGKSLVRFSSRFTPCGVNNIVPACRKDAEEGMYMRGGGRTGAQKWAFSQNVSRENRARALLWRSAFSAPVRLSLNFCRSEV